MSIGVMLFNPFTGKPRHPSDIESDPRGILIWDGEEPLRAAEKNAKPAEQQPVLYVMQSDVQTISEYETPQLIHASSRPMGEVTQPLYTTPHTQQADQRQEAWANKPAEQQPMADAAWDFADKVWREMDRRSMPGIYMQIVTKAVADMYPKYTPPTQQALREAASKDTERLDWLDKYAHIASWVDHEPIKMVIDAASGEEFTGDTWREAIDVAMRREEQQK